MTKNLTKLFYIRNWNYHNFVSSDKYWERKSSAWIICGFFYVETVQTIKILNIKFLRLRAWSILAVLWCVKWSGTCQWMARHRTLSTWANWSRSMRIKFEIHWTKSTLANRAILSTDWGKFYDESNRVIWLQLFKIITAECWESYTFKWPKTYKLTITFNFSDKL